MITFKEFLRDNHFYDEPVDVRREIDDISRRLRRASGTIFNAKDSTLTDAKEMILNLRQDAAEFLGLIDDFLTGRSVHL